MRVFLALGILAMMGCAAEKPIPAYKLNEYERPREDFSRRAPLQDDAPRLTREETLQGEG